MPRGVKRTPKPIETEYPAATTMEARENQLIALAYDLVEQRIRDGTASAAETVHFLKMGSQRDRIERDIMKEQKRLVAAKTGALDSAKRLEALYSDAIEAMRSYSGASSDAELPGTD